jgi:pantothenate kinase
LITSTTYGYAIGNSAIRIGIDFSGAFFVIMKSLHSQHPVFYTIERTQS